MTDWFDKGVLQHSQAARQHASPGNSCRVLPVVVGFVALLAGLGAALIRAWQGADVAHELGCIW